MNIVPILFRRPFVTLYPVVTIILVGLFLGLCTGFVMHRSDYCMAGMFRDLFLFRSTAMIKTFVLFLAISLPLFELSSILGFLELPFPKYGTPSLSNLLGGLLFGIGMVMAGGCAVGTLYKMGSGSIASMVGFTGMILGSILFAFLYPSWSLFAKELKLPTAAITLPELLGLPPALLVAPLLLLMIWLLRHWFRRKEMFRPAVVDGYLQPWKAAAILALLSVCFVLLMGLPMGVTTSNAKFGGMLVKQFAPDIYESNWFFNIQSFSYQSPLGGERLIGGPGANLDAVALVQFPLIIGIVAGAAISAIGLGEWKLHLRLPWPQAVSALLGGAIMGLSSRMAPSCNLWHLYGGLPILGLESILFLSGMVAGSWIGALIMSRLILSADGR